MPVHSPRADATRRRILEAALNCFAQGGFHGTSTRTIAKAANVTSPLLQHYFGGKAALFEAVLVEIIEDYQRAQARQFERPDDDLRFFTDGLRVMFRWLGAHPREVRLMNWARLQGWVIVPDSAAELNALVQHRFEAAQRHGLVRTDVDVFVALTMIDAMFKGYWSQRAGYEHDPELEPEHGPPEDAMGPESFLAQCLRVLLDGLLTPSAAERARVLLEREPEPS